MAANDHAVLESPARHTSLTSLPLPCILLLANVTLVMLTAAGCTDDADTIREIQSQRQARAQTQSVQDHLEETFALLSNLVDLNSAKASQQITYHLNQWRLEDEARSKQAADESAASPAILKTISDVLPTEPANRYVMRPEFVPSDVNHLRDCYLFREIARWVDDDSRPCAILDDWVESLNDIGAAEQSQLKTAIGLFDWTVRNIALEPRRQGTQFPSPPAFSFGMTFQGPGYRQSDYETAWRGTGDALQRAGVFTQLCRQASIPSAILATQSADTGVLTPWAVGVLIGDEIYLFEPELGIHVPGPKQVGIATLKQARSDESVMRRLNVPGFFDYPLTKQDVQQSVALLNILPEAISPRMRRLEQGLTGDRRMRVYVDVQAVSKQWDDASGIAGVRMWKVPVLAEVYRSELTQAASRDSRLGFWFNSRWAILDAQTPLSHQLARGRWQHLNGRFSNDETEDEKGARTYYLMLRAPEFEIDDLRIDVDLQKAYGIRRELRSDPKVYDRQVQQIQDMMRLGKRTATYWLSLVQYEDQRYQTARSWLQDRVLDDRQLSFWEPAARYNLARTAEQLGDFESAIELYKTEGSVQEHGNRIRARLLSKLEH